MDATGRETVLRVVKLKNPSPLGLLLLLKHPRPFDPKTDAVHYRVNRDWAEFSATETHDDWDFLDDEQCSSIALYIGFCESLADNYDHEDDVIIPLLSPEFTKLYDDNCGKDIDADEIKPFLGPVYRSEILFTPGGSCRMTVCAHNGNWAYEDFNWRFIGQTTVRDELRRDCVEKAAENHLARSRHLGDASLRAKLERNLAFSFGSPFRVTPTFEAHVYGLGQMGKLVWDEAEDVLAMNAKPYLYCNTENSAAALSVETKSKVYVRTLGHWILGTPRLDARWEKREIGIAQLTAAVSWWDHIGSTLPDGPCPDFSGTEEIHFVTTEDPCEGNDFRITALVKGELAVGEGHYRTCSAWISDKIPALDSENHMPSDEGDMRPWGGEYLYSLDSEEAQAAVHFWDGINYLKGTDVHLSDFVNWLGHLDEPL